MSTGSHHPSDTTLLAWVSGTADPHVEAHVRACPSCRAQADTWEALGTTLADALAEEADALIDEGRLARQRASIVRRLTGARARVLPFPARRLVGPSTAFGSEVKRWVAIAALIGLVVGTLAGRFVLEPRREALARSAHRSASPPHGGIALLPASGMAAAADEAFLVELDAALLARGPRSLRALDALTPDVYEAAASGR
jgi:anti-sigma factor RsiW